MPKIDSRPWPRRTLGTLLVTLFVAASAAAFEPLPRATPDSLGVDGARLEAALGELQLAPGARAAVVVCRGKVVGEAYWYGSANTLHHVWSVTKSVVSTLTGIAINRGFIAGVDDRMVDFLPRAYRPSDPGGDGVTVGNLLTMTSGFEWDENEEFSRWTLDPDPVRFILDRPLSAAPGSEFNYSTAAVHLLSPILQEATNLDPLEFADAYLFTPLGISDRAWTRDRKGRPFAGHGLKLRTEDQAKLGILFLQNGRWGGETVVSPEWVRRAVSIQYRGGSSYGALTDVHYGYLWWLAGAGGHAAYLAWGWGGQFVFCVPALDLVVSTNANGQVGEATATTQELAILDVIVNRIIPLFPIRYRSPLRASRRLTPLAPRLAGQRAEVERNDAGVGDSRAPTNVVERLRPR